MPISAESPSDKAKLGLSIWRRAWRGLVAWIEDHPRSSIFGAVVALILLAFYAGPLRGVSHLRESLSRWRVEQFGGVHEVDRSVQIYDVLLSFQPRTLDRLDVVSLFSNHVGGRSFEKELQLVIEEKKGRVRVVTLDPRMAFPSHPQHARFVALGKAFGQAPWQFATNVRHSASTLVALRERFGEGFEIRFTSRGLDDARAPFLTYGRSAHSYLSSDPTQRLDVIVPRPDSPDGADSLRHPAMVIRNRPQHPDVVRYSEAFEKLWAVATPLDAELTQTLISLTDG